VGFVFIFIVQTKEPCENLISTADLTQNQKFKIDFRAAKAMAKAERKRGEAAWRVRRSCPKRL
jgi:hypothetical protein